ncbi:MAG: DMT family transporter [Mycobacteriales bacterium]
MTYVLAVIAAAAFGVNWVLQQLEAAKAPPDLQMHPLRLLRLLIRKPLWLAGLLTLVAGSAVQQVALADGSLSVDEALLVLDLVFALLLADRISRRSVRPSQWIGAGAVCVGLGGFLAAAAPTAGEGGGAITRWITCGVVLGGLCVVLVAVGAAWPGTVRAICFATASALVFGASDALSKATFGYATEESLRGLTPMLSHWQLYGLIVSAVVGLGLGQVAFNAAALPVSLPSLAVGEPIAGLAIGIVALHVQVRTSPAPLAIACVGAVLVVAGSIVVGRSRVLDVAGQAIGARAAASTDPGAS